MEHIKYYFDLYKKQILLTIISITTLLIACISFFIINSKYNNDEIIHENNAVYENDNSLSAVIEKESESEIVTTENKIKIDIKGCIKNPGVYEITTGKRVIDVIELAGGLTQNAHTGSLNLSQKLNDEDVIIIYSKEENKTNIKNNQINQSKTSGVITKKTETKVTSTTKSQGGTSNDNSTLNTIVNINTASKETLMTLNGIGESKAKLIIEYRETNGNFKTTDEIKNVKGIGEAIYEKIKDSITI